MAHETDGMTSIDLSRLDEYERVANTAPADTVWDNVLVQALIARIRQLEHRYAQCIYCGLHIEYAPTSDATRFAAYDQIVAHDRVCPKNPLVAELRAAHDQLWSQHHALGEP